MSDQKLVAVLILFILNPATQHMFIELMSHLIIPSLLNLDICKPLYLFILTTFTMVILTQHFYSSHFCLIILNLHVWKYIDSKYIFLYINAHKIYISRPWLVWLSWLEHCPINWNVTGLIPSQGTCPGCHFSPQPGHVWEGNHSMTISHIDVSVSLCFSPPSLPLSKNNEKKCPRVRIKVNFKYVFTPLNFRDVVSVLWFSVYFILCNYCLFLSS